MRDMGKGLERIEESVEEVVKVRSHKERRSLRKSEEHFGGAEDKKGKLDLTGSRGVCGTPCIKSSLSLYRVGSRSCWVRILWQMTHLNLESKTS